MKLEVSQDASKLFNRKEFPMNLLYLSKLKEAVEKKFPVLFKEGTINVKFDNLSRVFKITIYKTRNPNNNNRVNTVESLAAFDCIQQLAQKHYLGKDENDKIYFAHFSPYEVNE